jgi:hypothetical protein
MVIGHSRRMGRRSTCPPEALCGNRSRSPSSGRSTVGVSAGLICHARPSLSRGTGPGRDPQKPQPWRPARSSRSGLRGRPCRAAPVWVLGRGAGPAVELRAPEVDVCLPCRLFSDRPWLLSPSAGPARRWWLRWQRGGAAHLHRPDLREPTKRPVSTTDPGKFNLLSRKPPMARFVRHFPSVVERWCCSAAPDPGRRSAAVAGFTCDDRQGVAGEKSDQRVAGGVDRDAGRARVVDAQADNDRRGTAAALLGAGS